MKWRWGALAIFAVAIATRALVACRPDADVPCRTDDTRVLSSGEHRASLVVGPNGVLVLGALHLPTSRDAGAPDAASDASSDAADAGDAGDAGGTPSREPLPDRFDVTTFDSSGAVAHRVSLAAPSPLRARRGSTLDTGAIWSGQGALFHWIEATVTTDADGTRRSGSRLVAAFVREDGTELPSREIVHCTFCTLTASGAATGTATTLLWGRGPATDGVSVVGADNAAAVGYLSVAPDGSTLASGDATWLIATLPTIVDAGLGVLQAPPVARIESLGDVLLARNATRLWLVDARVAPLAGPVPAPSNAAIAWDRTRHDVAVSWAGGASLASTVDDAVGTSPDVYFRRYDEQGNAVTTRLRVTTADAVAAVGGDDAAGYGAVVLESGHVYFAWSDAAGHKQGGDLDLSGASPAGPAMSDGSSQVALGPTFGSTGAAAGGAPTHFLVRSGPGFVDTSLESGALIRREISCGH